MPIYEPKDYEDEFKEWAVELRTEIHLYYCDNQDCPEKVFLIELK